MTWGDAMKDIKEKPTAHMPRSNATGGIPKAALKKAWAEAKEKSRTMLRESTSTQGDGDYIHIKNIASMILRNGSAFLAAQSIMILFTLWTFTKLTRSPVRMEEFLL